jgi:hypothetical protein
VNEEQSRLLGDKVVVQSSHGDVLTVGAKDAQRESFEFKKCSQNCTVKSF